MLSKSSKSCGFRAFNYKMGGTCVEDDEDFIQIRT